MKKKYKRLYIIIFLLFSIIPLLMYPFSKSGAELEKREPVETPLVMRDGYMNPDFANECEAWLADRLPLRPVVLTAANMVKSGLLKSDTSNVVTGKDGWIFCEASVADYMNTNALSEERLRSMAVSFSLIEENVKAKGGKFLFVPMPNKASVYSEFMPSRYRKAETNNLLRLQKMLSEQGVSYIDMLELMKGRKSFGLYHKRDTHWNYYGALIGYYSITDALGKKHKMYSDTDYIPKKIWHGDIEKMLYPAGLARDYQIDLNLRLDPFEFVIPAGVTDKKTQLETFMSDREENDKRILTRRTSSLGNGKLYMVRDSFGRALLPFFIDNYDQAMFVRADYPDLSMVEAETDMVYEIVERNISDLFRTAPLMPAPVRTEVSAGTPAGDTVNFIWRDEEYGTKIYGELAGSQIASDGRVYVRLFNDNTSVIFEAFPIYEEKLLGGEGKCGFSMIADASYLTAGEYQVQVICGDRTFGAVSDKVLEFTEESIEKAKANASQSDSVKTDSDTENESTENVAEEDGEIQSEAQWIEGTTADRAKVVYNGVTLAAGDNINELLESLGSESAPSSSAESCLTGKPILEYYYAGMTIQAAEDGTIASIEISENLYPGTDAKTAGGIGCGSTRNDVFAAFGKAEEPDASNIVYKDDGSDVKVQVIFKDDAVSVILITGPGA